MCTWIYRSEIWIGYFQRSLSIFFWEKEKAFKFSPTYLEKILLSAENTSIFWTNQNFTHESGKNLQHNTDLFNLRKCSCRLTAFREKCCIRPYLQNLYGEPMLSWENSVYTPLKSRYLKFASFSPFFPSHLAWFFTKSTKAILSHFGNALFTHPTFIAFDTLFLTWWIITFGARQ